MLIQKIIIIVPDEVNEVVYNVYGENEYYIRFNLDDLNKLHRKIKIYRTFDFNCQDNNWFDLYLYHKDYDWKNFHYPFHTSFNYYISKMEYEITFNKLDEDFEFTINGVSGKK
jgi:hypothetical protein